MPVTLDLKFPINRDTERRGYQGTTYQTEGSGKNCSSIEEHPSGWRIVINNQVAYIVPHTHVEGVEVRPDHAPAETAQLPAYLSKVDGGYRCNECGKVCPTLHGARTHHGIHARE